MIVIFGFSGIDVSQLPSPEALEYKIFQDNQKMIAMKLASQDKCISFFIHKSYENAIDTTSITKPVYFVNDEQSIINIINNVPVEEEKEVPIAVITTDLDELKLDVVNTYQNPPSDNSNIIKEDEVKSEVVKIEDNVEITDDDIDFELEEPNSEETLDSDIDELDLKFIEDTIRNHENDEDTLLILSADEETAITMEQVSSENPLEWVDDSGDVVKLGEEVTKEQQITTYDNEKITKLEDRIKTLETELEVMTDENFTLTSQLTVKKDTENMLRGTISKLEKDITDITLKLDNTLKIADNRLKQQQTSFNEKIKIANETIQEYATKMDSYRVTEATKNCEAFSSYTLSPKSVVRVPFTESEKMTLGTIKNNVQLITYKGTDSLQILQDEIYALMKTNSPCLIADFTGDLYMSTKYKLKTKSSCLDSDKFLTKDIVEKFNGTNYIGTTTFNDVSLLTLKWDTIISNFMSFAPNMPILILLGDVDNFSTRYIISKIGTEIAKTTIIVNATPRNLMSVQVSHMYLPDVKKKLFIMGYKDTFKTVVTQLRGSFEVHPFVSNIEWNKLWL